MELPPSSPDPEIDMTTNEKVARRKRSLLELATALGNVSKACRVMGYSRRQFYESRRNFQTYGATGCSTAWPAPVRRIPTGSAPRSSRRSSTTRWLTPAIRFLSPGPGRGPGCLLTPWSA